MIRLKTKVIQNEIEARGLKNTWIAKQVGISRTYFETILHGHKGPSKEVLKILAKVLGLRQEEISDFPELDKLPDRKKD